MKPSCEFSWPTLHAIAFLGGTPGALIGQKVFRHKTIKRSFRLVFWLRALLQAGLVGLWLWREEIFP